MTTPPKPSPEAVAAAVSTLTRHNEWRRGAEIEMESPRVIGEAIDTVIAGFAPIIAKAELCDRLAAVLKRTRKATPANIVLIPEVYEKPVEECRLINVIDQVLADYARAAGPAVAGGGRED